ncbi:hypothetical protein SAMN05216266_11489 [Amycolatopsis marina]|uniref:Uncharacterized protein n=1 Tax=Amycolatopsis marina TaxID=490629 RepID=A0A1I1BJA7_9PSEU|nr:hypothetical protein SAMN05216266_11489 [Amycolatopsis marina]
MPTTTAPRQCLDVDRRSGPADPQQGCRSLNGWNTSVGTCCARPESRALDRQGTSFRTGLRHGGSTRTSSPSRPHRTSRMAASSALRQVRRYLPRSARCRRPRGHRVGGGRDSARWRRGSSIPSLSRRRRRRCGSRARLPTRTRRTRPRSGVGERGRHRGPSTPWRGCPSTVPSTAARRGTPTPRTTRGCGSDRRRPRTRTPCRWHVRVPIRGIRGGVRTEPRGRA